MWVQVVLLAHKDLLVLRDQLELQEPQEHKVYKAQQAHKDQLELQAILEQQVRQAQTEQTEILAIKAQLVSKVPLV
jgi:hypothetical protein